MKKNVWVALAFLVSLGVSESMAVTPGRVTMLVVPSRYSVMQIAFDMAQKHPVVLVSYQGDASSDAPLLHAWNGKEWIKISAEEYANASFLQVTPGEALLIGDEKLLPPVLTTAISGWCPKVTTIPSIDTAVLVNTFAKEFSFKRGEWEWFAKRYNLALNDENAARRSASWYDQPAYEDEYSPKVDRWFGRRRTVQPPAETMEPITTEPEVGPEGGVPVEVPVESEPLPAGADAEMSTPPPEAAFTAAPMQEEAARKALQAPPADSEPVAVPAPEVIQSLPADAGVMP